MSDIIWFRNCQARMYFCCSAASNLIAHTLSARRDNQAFFPHGTREVHPYHISPFQLQMQIDHGEIRLVTPAVVFELAITK